MYSIQDNYNWMTFNFMHFHRMHPARRMCLHSNSRIERHPPYRPRLTSNSGYSDIPNGKESCQDTVAIRQKKGHFDGLLLYPDSSRFCWDISLGRTAQSQEFTCPFISSDQHIPFVLIPSRWFSPKHQNLCPSFRRSNAHAYIQLRSMDFYRSSWSRPCARRCIFQGDVLHQCDLPSFLPQFPSLHFVYICALAGIVPRGQSQQQ